MLGQIEQRMLNLAFSGLQIGIGIYDKDGHMMTSNEEFNRLKIVNCCVDQSVKGSLEKSSGFARMGLS